MRVKIFNNHFYILLFIIAFHLFILSKLIFFPYPELFIYPYLTEQGLLPYKQIMDQHFPGMMFFPVNFATLGMTNEIIARYWSFGVVVIIHILIYIVGSKLFKNKTKALLSNVVFLVWQPYFEGWVLWIDSFLPILLLSALYFTLSLWEQDKRRNFILAGLLFGIGIVFKQVVIPLAVIIGIMIFIRYKSLKKLTWYLVGLFPPPVLMVIYFYNLGVFRDFWYWTVTFNLTVFAEGGRKLPSVSGIGKVLAVFGISIFSLLSKTKYQVILTLIFLLGSLASAYARFDFVHFQPALPFVCLLTIFALEWLLKGTTRKILVGFYVIGTILLLITFYRGHVGEKVFFFDTETKSIANKIMQITEPSERIFIFGSIPHLYQMSGTLPSGDVFVHQFSWFLEVAEGDILDGIKKDKPELIVADRSVHVDGQYIVDYASQINEYLLENYHTVDKVGTTEFLIRN